MSFDSLLTHTVTHVHTPTDDRVASRDDYGQPVAMTPVRAAVRALVQPRTATLGAEALDPRSAGIADSDHVIFLQPMTLDGSDWFEFGGDRYDIVTIRDYAFGSQAHLEVDARRLVPVTPALVDEAGS